MTFVNAGGDKVSFTIAGVKSSITQAEVSTLMDAIIANDIFLTSGGALASKYGAQLVQRQATKFVVQ